MASDGNVDLAIALDPAGPQVAIDCCFNPAIKRNFSTLQKDTSSAESGDGADIVAYKNDGSPLALCNGFHFSKAFVLKLAVTNCEDLVDNQDFRLEMCGYGKGEAHIHAARIAFNRRVYELLHLCERDDLVEFTPHFGTRHSEYRSVQKDILTARQVRVEAGSYLEERSDPPTYPGDAGGRLRDATEDFKERRLTCAVTAYYPDHFSGLDAE